MLLLTFLFIYFSIYLSIYSMIKLYWSVLILSEKNNIYQLPKCQILW